MFTSNWRRVMVGTIALVAAVALTACVGESTAPTAGDVSKAPPATAANSHAVIVDTDLGADDIIALATLLRAPTVDVLAVTVSGTGLVHCPAGSRHVLRLLAAFGKQEQPVGCGRSDAGLDGLTFPGPWRAVSDRLYDLELPPAEDGGDQKDAVAVMRTAISSSRRDVTIVALGPWTNLEDLVARHPEAVGRVAGIHAMAGAIDVAGNVAGAGESVAEWNVRADPSAFAAVLRSGIPVTLVPLDATNTVPLTPDFRDRLARDRSAVGANVTWQLLSRNPVLLSGGMYLWDALAAIALVNPSLVRTERLHLQVDTAEPHAGRTLRSASGPEVQVALGADGAQAVDAILEALRAGS
jgi:inosine-uridine nucleoside N-ribohydrolase